MGDLVLVEVVAAVIERDGEVLITRRPPGTHLAGFWEFPGGKRHHGEALDQALRREIAEELGVQALVGDKIETIDWAYADKCVRLHFFRCTVAGEPHPREGQEMVWVPPDDLSRYEFPAADAALLTHLKPRP